jgi:hypothetical protein
MRARFRRAERLSTCADVIVDVAFEERYWYPDEGGQVWLAGYTPLDAEGRYLGRGAPELAALGLRISGVAGAARHHAAALTADAAAPGHALTLRHDPDNPHDPHAVAVHLAGGGEQLGWVPREIAPELTPGAPWSAVVLREQRPSPRDPRSGVTMLLAPAAELELRELPGGP